MYLIVCVCVCNFLCHVCVFVCITNVSTVDKWPVVPKGKTNIPILSEVRGLRQVVVYYRGSDGISGIYRCDIETIAVNNNSGNVSIFVGLYIGGGE